MVAMLRAALFATVAAVLALVPLKVSAQDYPTRPVRLIVPLGAGGPTDIVGRYLAAALSEQLKQSFFVENRPGAAGIIGTAEAAKAAGMAGFMATAQVIERVLRAYYEDGVLTKEELDKAVGGKQ